MRSRLCRCHHSKGWLHSQASCTQRLNSLFGEFLMHPDLTAVFAQWEAPDVVVADCDGDPGQPSGSRITLQSQGEVGGGADGI